MLVVISRLIPRKCDPVAVMKAQEHWKRELRERIRFPERERGVPEAILIRLKKKDDYPETKIGLFNLGASDWFKAEIKEIADSTLDIYSQITNVSISDGVAREVLEPDGDSETVFVVGRIPLEKIRHIRWTDDPAYGLPRIYLDYGWGGPYSETALYRIPEIAGDYEFPIHDVKFRPIKRSLWRRFRDNQQLRRMEREAELP